METTHTGTAALPRELPLIGRTKDLESLHTIFGDPAATPAAVLITGEGGVGKSRLAGTIGVEARRRGWRVAYGRAYPVETGVPYALLADALLPILRPMDDAALSVLTRGSQADLRTLFPVLGTAADRGSRGDDPKERRTRLFWTFTEMVQRLGQREPLLIVLEDLQWADASSVALLHFLIRHLTDESVRILGTYNVDDRHQNEPLIGLERSLLSLRKLRVHPVHPLDEGSTRALVEEVFHAAGPAVDDFSRLLFGWTGGNPYFIEQTLDALVETGVLHERNGTWLGWGARELELPSTVRDAIMVRCRHLSAEALAIAELMAVIGNRASASLLERVSGFDQATLVQAVEELIDRGLVDESHHEGTLVFEIRHPITRATWYQGLSRSRARMLHGTVAEGLESVYGSDALDHADELAYHFSQAHAPAGKARALRYLAVAGRSALHRHADQEAVSYLEAALTQLEGGQDRADPPPLSTQSPPDPGALRRDLARAKARLGKYAEACGLWSDLLHEAQTAGDGPRIIQAQRHLGLVWFWSGNHALALEHLDAARVCLDSANAGMEALLQMTAGVVLQEMGRADASRERLQAALALAEGLGEPGLLARIHRALALLHTWLGHGDEAREHGWRAVELAEQAGDRTVAFWGRWALATLEGLCGGPNAIAQPLSAARAVADELRSPVLRLWVTELAVEHAHFRGDWDRALAEGERAIRLAESLNQRTLLVRLLVWTACTYIHRGDVERGRELIQRAWSLVNRGEVSEARDVHATVPAFIGRVALAMADQDYDEAIRLGTQGLAVADRSGYVIWVLHRLLPMVGEACLRAGRRAEAVRVATRLQREGQRMDHRLALAWARAGEAVACWHGGKIKEAAGLLRDAAARMEGIGIIYEAARLRRQLAGRLAELEDREGALSELKHAHDVFAKLGADPELTKARDQFRELGSRAPTRTRATGTACLTGRETEVARLIAGRRSNKAVAKALGISPRTVTTHLTNIYRKLDIGTRGELVDLVREARLPTSGASSL